MRALVLLLVLVPAAAGAACAKVSGPVLERARPYLPILSQEVRAFWPEMELPEYLAAQVEQESLWNPCAELRTEREWGAGFAQWTRAYNADGSVRFDSFRDEARKLDGSLADWKWEDRFDPRRSLRSLILFDRKLTIRAETAGLVSPDSFAAGLAAYNGGVGSVLGRIRLCEAKGPQVCNPRLWFRNLETDSNLSRARWKGYGESAHDTNSQYPRRVMLERAPKYRDQIPGFQGMP